MKSCAYSNKGSVRTENQDAFAVSRDSYAVFDGIGGESCGAEASRTARDIYKKYLCDRSFSSDKELREQIHKFSDESQKAIRTILNENNATHGGTTAAGITFFNGKALVYYIGDSRVYLLRNGRLYLLSHDMTAAQDEIDKGSLSPDEARQSRGWHLLTSYLGDSVSVIHIGETIPIEPGDRFLLCTDGVSDSMPDNCIEKILRWPMFIAKWLLRSRALKNGDDNFTFIMVGNH